MNVRDSEVICGLLRAQGYELTTEPEDADIILFNTCSVRQHAEDKVWSEVGRLVKAKKIGKVPIERGQSLFYPIIGIIGCMAQNYGDKIFERAPAVDFVVGPSDIQKIPEIIEKVASQEKKRQFPGSGNRVHAVGDSPFFVSKIWETEGNSRPEEIYHTGFYEDKEHAYVVISEGCSNYCSYCVVPHVRGELHNRGHQDILDEIRQALDKGITKITLLGQNVNAYQDKDVDFVKFVRLVNSVNGLKEFDFVTSHPKDTSMELFKAMAEAEKLRKYLHLPVQSGSDRILKFMNRGYTRKYYLEVADNYRKIVKDGALTTDVIVGFPGETDEDFRDTYNLIKEVEFNAAFIFKYSTRPHTHAQNYEDSVPKEEKERRHALILELQKMISKKKK